MDQAGVIALADELDHMGRCIHVSSKRITQIRVKVVNPSC